MNLGAAFRLTSHHLNERLPSGSLLLAASACGFQNTPPGSAALSLHARIAGFTLGKLEAALFQQKNLLQMWSFRASPHIFPTQDAAIFTRGLLPGDEASTRAYIFGVEAALEKIGMTATQAVGLTAEAAWEVLDGQVLTKDELGIRLASRISTELDDRQREPWLSPSWYAAGQSLGESVVRFALPVLALKGICCHVERRKNKAYIGRMDQWLETMPPLLIPEQARAELVRRYLHCYGPSTSAHLANWAGISPIQAAQSWKLVEQELVEISTSGRKAWLLLQDLAHFESPPSPLGIRFLPPHDPYIQGRDRQLLVPDQEKQKIIWRPAGSPGVILVDGEVSGIWRSKKKSSRLFIHINWLVPVPPAIRERVEVEASSLAPFWDCISVTVNDFQL